ncbi:C-terminal TonB protein [Azorhizobium caulinodans ORS 571]|uniref:C-terminal TonB protein n=1 Tax=Azorhizobium caulinodans (strain ATCC 43989 / DSM 5975 / JCM 20966 / LMG 6465 / NBRC 14845 / NCIMB 13405 / ORS 571) TaxID=438753 RepID=A8I0I0_AZOC5|nr:energy transducer TonB [Azorhizobium caulinodans]BAF87258.1 C-terminal TonB protein [Azorhizobium caulinodans ORS 571]
MTATYPHHHHEHHGPLPVGRWVLAGALILAIHGGAVYAGLKWHKVEGISEPPPAAVMIDLAPLPVAPPSETEDVAPGPQMVQAPEPVPDAPDTMEDSTPPPTPEVVEEPIEKMPDLPTPPVMAEAVLPPPRPIVQEPPPPQKKPEEKKPEKKASRRPAAPVTSAAPKLDAPTSNAIAAPSAGASSSASTAPATWRSMIVGHLNRYKRYPSEARAKREEGTARLRFTIDRAGRVIGASLAGTSGHALLDEETLEMVRRASPFPAPPAEVAGASITFTVPVDFNVR